MSQYKILVSCMGGYGAEYLVEGMRRSSIGKDVSFVGTHVDPFLLSCSTAENNYLVPYAREKENYIEANRRIIEKENIDFFVPKSDREVLVVSESRDRFPCRLYLPEHEEILACQDKLSFYQILEKAGVAAARTFQIHSFDEIGRLMSDIGEESQYWIRVKTAGEAGAFAATWVRTPQQAEKWINLWQELHDIPLTEFTVSEFLPGRLFECLVLFYEGSLKLAKIYENNRFYGAEQRLSGMASTPDLAQSVNDDEARQALKEAVRAVEEGAAAVGVKPHGCYHLSTKGDKRGRPCITESNIGRFPSTCGFFEVIGRHSVAGRFTEYGLGCPPVDLDDPYDVAGETTHIVWSLGKRLMTRTQEEIDRFAASADMEMAR